VIAKIAANIQAYPMRKYLTLLTFAMALTLLGVVTPVCAEGGALDSLVGVWKCGSYAIRANRAMHVVNMEHLVDRRGKAQARFLIQLDDTHPEQIVAQGSMFDWTFAAMAKGRSDEGWTFYGPAESGSNETSIKLVIRQTAPGQFEETVQWLKATSAYDPGKWMTLLSGSCRAAK
jgi:hypothetical protein